MGIGQSLEHLAGGLRERIHRAEIGCRRCVALDHWVVERVRIARWLLALSLTLILIVLALR